MNQREKDEKWAADVCIKYGLPTAFARTLIKAIAWAKREQIPFSRALQFVQR